MDIFDAQDQVFSAIDSRDVARLARALNSGAQADHVGRGGQYPASVAAADGWIEGLRMLGEAGADWDSQDWNQARPLHQACAHGHAECAAFLISQGAHPSPSDEEGHTPATRAARAGHLQCLALLADAGADLDASTNHSATPFMMAALGGHRDCLDLLARRGADLAARTPYGESARDWALQCSCSAPQALALSEFVDALIERQAIDKASHPARPSMRSRI